MKTNDKKDKSSRAAPYLGRIPLGRRAAMTIRPRKGKGAYTRKRKHRLRSRQKDDY